MSRRLDEDRIDETPTMTLYLRGAASSFLKDALSHLGTRGAAKQYVLNLAGARLTLADQMAVLYVPLAADEGEVEKLFNELAQVVRASDLALSDSIQGNKSVAELLTRFDEERSRHGVRSKVDGRRSGGLGNNALIVVGLVIAAVLALIGKELLAPAVEQSDAKAFFGR